METDNAQVSHISTGRCQECESGVYPHGAGWGMPWASGLKLPACVSEWCGEAVCDRLIWNHSCTRIERVLVWRLTGAWYAYGSWSTVLTHACHVQWEHACHCSQGIVDHFVEAPHQKPSWCATHTLTLSIWYVSGHTICWLSPTHLPISCTDSLLSVGQFNRAVKAQIHCGRAASELYGMCWHYWWFGVGQRWVVYVERCSDGRHNT